MSSAAIGGGNTSITRDGKNQRRNDTNDNNNYAAWRAAIDAKMAGARAAMQAAIQAAKAGEKPYGPDGRSYSGNDSPPSVPSDTSTSSGGFFCGVGSSTYCLVGNGVTDIMIKLFAHEVKITKTTTYNWVQDKAPSGDGYYVPKEPGEWHGESGTTVSAVDAGGDTACDSFHYFAYDDPDWPDDPRGPKGNKSRLYGFMNHADNLFNGLVTNSKGNLIASPGRLQSNTLSLGGFCEDEPFRIRSWDIFETHELDVPIYKLEGEYIKEGAFHPAVMFDVTYPGSSFVMQVGSPMQGYTPLEGAFVFDMHLKKWGKMKHTYSVAVDFNQLPGNDYSNTGISAGLMHTDGRIRIMDDEPAEGFIRYGKIGFYRLGMTRLLETRIDLKDPASGKVRIDSSMDGRNLDALIFKEYVYNNAVTVRMYPDIQARWFTIKISGKYDLQYMEVRGNITGRR